MRRTFTPNPPGIGSPCGLRYMLGSALRSAPLGGRRPWGSKDWYVFSAVVVMSLLPPVPKGRHKAIAYIWGKERGVFQGRTGLVSTSFAPQSSTDLSLYVPPTRKSSPLPHHLTMAPKSESSTIVPDSTVYPPLRDNDTWLLEVAKIQVLHEATLQDLLQTRNDAVTHILHERNELLRERSVVPFAVGTTLSHSM